MHLEEVHITSPRVGLLGSGSILCAGYSDQIIARISCSARRRCLVYTSIGADDSREMDTKSSVCPTRLQAYTRIKVR
jgi:hypothetical protein